ncbi:hypothetical protein JXM67_02920 [candidate division WOR-3 bacterium]|nr:hypothetical protein [candidate division WOR-3 bacterium]
MTYDRGSTAILTRDWLKERFGEDGLKKVAGKLKADAYDMLLNTHSNAWYPTPLIKEVYKVISDEYAGRYPDVMYDCGRYCAQKSATGILRFLMKNISIENLFKRTKSFWKHFNKGGGAEILKLEDEEGEKKMKFIIHEYDVGVPGCQTMHGFIEGIAGMADSKTKEVHVEKKECLHNGDDFCAWEINWKV